MSEHPREKKSGGSRVAPKQQKSVTPRQKKREKQIMVVMIVLAVIMVLAAAVVVLYNRWVQKPTLPSHNDTPSPGISQSADPDESGEPDPEESAEPDYDPVQPKVSGTRKSEDFYSILIFGADESSGLTDTMMVVSYDVTNQKATVMSIPRDTLANTRFSGVDAKKMNAVYKFNGKGEKGVEALRKEVSELVGFVPDYYVMIDWAIVGKMVDAIGGVYFEVPWDMWYSDPYQDLYIDLKEGYQLLDGDKAMQLVRWRKNMDPKTYKILSEHNNGDVGRLKIQQDFLKAALKQALQLKNLTKISQVAQLFSENVTSDLSVENLFWFASRAIMGGLSVEDVEFVTMPYNYGEYPYKSGDSWKTRSFVYPAQKSLLTLINESLNPFVEDVTLRELDLIYVRADGGLSSTSGSLADSSMASVPEEYLAWKNGETTSEPDGTDGETDAPDADPDVETSPGTDGDPSVSEEPGDDEEMPGWLKPDNDPDASGSSDPSAAPTDPNWYVTDPVPTEDPTSSSDIPTE